MGQAGSSNMASGGGVGGQGSGCAGNAAAHANQNVYRAAKAAVESASRSTKKRNRQQLETLGTRPPCMSMHPNALPGVKYARCAVILMKVANTNPDGTKLVDWGPTRVLLRKPHTKGDDLKSFAVQDIDALDRLEGKLPFLEPTYTDVYYNNEHCRTGSCIKTKKYRNPTYVSFQAMTLDQIDAKGDKHANAKALSCNQKKQRLHRPGDGGRRIRLGQPRGQRRWHGAVLVRRAAARGI
jgi:hypothetical protein